MLRMTSSGTEASMTAIRLARAATGRERVLKFAGAYHGHVDGLLAQAGSGLATQGIPAQPRRAGGRRRADDRGGALERPRGGRARACAEHELAAILAEPLPANMGLVPPREGFLELLRERADAKRRAARLDEVISGFRVARGGAQELRGRERRSDDHGQGDRRRAAGGGLGGPAELMSGSRRPATSTRRARCRATRSRWPPGWRRWSCSTSPPTRASGATTERLAAGLREAAGGAGVRCRCRARRAC